MPELPEVETIRTTLEPKLIGRIIEQAEVLHSKLVQDESVTSFCSRIKGREILAVKRRGKYLLIELSGKLTLAVHLRMTGQLSVTEAGEPVEKATYLRVTLDNGWELRFRDLRKFGRVWLFDQEKIPSGIAGLGPEPLGPDFSPAVLKKGLAHRNVAIKKTLLEQELVAGIGNIYADEALFLAGIRPERPANSLNDRDLNNLVAAIKQVLQEGIEFRGTTKRDYRDGEGKPGTYQDRLRVYGRKGLPCPNCGTAITKIKLGGRGTHFCERCQR